MSLATTLSARVIAAYLSAGDHGVPRVDYELACHADMATGTGAAQADRVFSDQRTINASSSETLDLAGALADAFGQTITFVKVKAILIRAAAANTNNVIIGDAAAPFLGWLGAAAHTITLAPGDWVMLAAPTSGGKAVTAVTADGLKIANSGAGSAVIYDIVIIGASA